MKPKQIKPKQVKPEQVKRKHVIAPVIQNRRARYDYEIFQTVNAGLSLAGPEVKSIRGGNASLSDSFARIDKNEVFLYNMYIAPYPCSREELDVRRPRKLLLHKQEVLKLSQAVVQKGLTLIPLRVHFRRGWAKVEIAVAKSKKQFDKREKIRRRVSDLEMHNRS